MLRLLRAFAVATAAALVLPALASAQPPRSAQRFADTVERAKAAVNGLEAEVRRSAAEVDIERCIRVFERKVPARASERVLYVQVVAFLGPMLRPSLPIMERIVSDLDAIETNDPALQRGRAAWRAAVALYRRVPVLERPCHQLERWARAGFPAASAPPVRLADMRRLLHDDENDRWERDLSAAARRLRALGVSAGDARRFTGDDLFSEVEEIVVDASGDAGAAARVLVSSSAR